jgi:hypothetical protein
MHHPAGSQFCCTAGSIHHCYLAASSLAAAMMPTDLTPPYTEGPCPNWITACGFHAIILHLCADWKVGRQCAVIIDSLKSRSRHPCRQHMNTLHQQATEARNSSYFAVMCNHDKLMPVTEMGLTFDTSPWMSLTGAIVSSSATYNL